jgi:hypothetical protein
VQGLVSISNPAKRKKKRETERERDRERERRNKEILFFILMNEIDTKNIISLIYNFFILHKPLLPHYIF